jgi:hypothetical protein
VASLCGFGERWSACAAQLREAVSGRLRPECAQRVGPGGEPNARALATPPGPSSKLRNLSQRR